MLVRFTDHDCFQSQHLPIDNCLYQILSGSVLVRLLRACSSRGVNRPSHPSHFLEKNV